MDFVIGNIMQDILYISVAATLHKKMKFIFNTALVTHVTNPVIKRDAIMAASFYLEVMVTQVKLNQWSSQVNIMELDQIWFKFNTWFYCSVCSEIVFLIRITALVIVNFPIMRIIELLLVFYAC